MKYLISINEFYNIDHRDVFNNKKIKHSLSVAELVIRYKKDQDVYDAALYHDYLESGGDISDISGLSDYSKSLIIALTDFKENKDPLNKLKSSVKGKYQLFIDDLFLIKLCDRCDNLKKRYNNKSLSKNYIDKSKKLLNWITNNMSTDYYKKYNIGKLIKNNFTHYIKNK